MDSVPILFDGVCFCAYVCTFLAFGDRLGRLTGTVKCEFSKELPPCHSIPWVGELTSIPLATAPLQSLIHVAESGSCGGMGTVRVISASSLRRQL